jgi:hypothetical protein
MRPAEAGVGEACVATEDAGVSADEPEDEAEVEDFLRGGKKLVYQRKGNQKSTVKSARTDFFAPPSGLLRKIR